MISHEVTIIAIDIPHKTVRLRLEATGACTGCAAKQACALHENQDKEWTVYCPEADTYTVGEKASLMMHEKTGFKAVGWAYTLPTACLIGLIAGLSCLTDNELIAGLAALGCVIVYILILWWMRRHLSRTLTYTISHLPNA
ncbi:MAG: SoxR reducing system RseC family protein [Bacteroidales bacterium]|nr:SoxR reducing system RseC family protein [Bacteroidales bacterium]